MGLQFHNLKLSLNTKGRVKEFVFTRYAKLGEHISNMLRGNKDNVKNIKLQDKDTNRTIELIGSDETDKEILK